MPSQSIFKSYIPFIKVCLDFTPGKNYNEITDESVEFLKIKINQTKVFSEVSSFQEAATVSKEITLRTVEWEKLFPAKSFETSI